MKVIFMGTPEFAAVSLIGIIESAHDVVSVFTSMPKPRDRGMKVTKSHVHLVAEEYKIPVYTPCNIRSQEVYEQIDAIDADVIVVVAYGFIIPKSILNAKRYGCLNVHPSMLPKYRGAAPLQSAIIEGDNETGVCVIRMNEGVDTGDILAQENFPIHNSITLKELHDISAQIGAKLLVYTMDNMRDIKPVQQSSDGATYASKLTKDDGIVSWQDSALTIDRKIRAMTPWPGVFFYNNGEIVKLVKATYVEVLNYSGSIGDIVMESFVVCGDGLLKIELVQKPNRSAVSFEEFIRNNVWKS